MRTLVLILAVTLLLLPSVSSAWTVTVTGALVTIEYDEPTTNTDGSALVDLQDTKQYYDIGAGWIECNNSPTLATALTGGGHIVVTCDVPVTAGMERDVNFKINACDTSENCSEDSSILTVRIDRLAPSPIQ